MRYFVDIDNTICVTEGSDYDNSIPMFERIDYVNDLYDAGNYIVYWTARGQNSGIDWTKETKKQLELWGCKYHELRMNKPSFDIFIDDKAFNSEVFFK